MRKSEKLFLTVLILIGLVCFVGLAVENNRKSAKIETNELSHATGKTKQSFHINFEQIKKKWQKTVSLTEKSGGFIKNKGGNVVLSRLDKKTL